MAESAPLLREYGFIAHRGFESLPLRQLHLTKLALDLILSLYRLYKSLYFTRPPFKAR